MEGGLGAGWHPPSCVLDFGDSINSCCITAIFGEICQAVVASVSRLLCVRGAVLGCACFILLAAFFLLVPFLHGFHGFLLRWREGRNVGALARCWCSYTEEGSCAPWWT